MSLIGHEAEMPKYLGKVRYWMNSGQHLLGVSFSVFDPLQTWCSNAAWNGCGRASTLSR